MNRALDPSVAVMMATPPHADSAMGREFELLRSEPARLVPRLLGLAVGGEQVEQHAAHQQARWSDGMWRSMPEFMSSGTSKSVPSSTSRSSAVTRRSKAMMSAAGARLRCRCGSRTARPGQAVGDRRGGGDDDVVEPARIADVQAAQERHVPVRRHVADGDGARRAGSSSAARCCRPVRRSGRRSWNPTLDGGLGRIGVVDVAEGVAVNEVDVGVVEAVLHQPERRAGPRLVELVDGGDTGIISSEPVIGASGSSSATQTWP